MKIEDIRRASRHHIPKYRCISFYILYSSSQEGVLYYVYERKTKGFLTWKFIIATDRHFNYFLPFCLYMICWYFHIWNSILRKKFESKKGLTCGRCATPAVSSSSLVGIRKSTLFFLKRFLIMNNKCLKKKRDGQTDETAAAAAAAAGTFELL